MFSEKIIASDIVHFYNAAEAIEYLRNNTVDCMLLDHDLGLADTGYDFVKSLYANNIIPECEIIIHSQNPIGAGNMLKYISQCFPHANVAVFPGLFGKSEKFINAVILYNLED